MITVSVSNRESWDQETRKKKTHYMGLLASRSSKHSCLLVLK